MSTLAGIYMQSGRMQEGLAMMKSVSDNLTQDSARKFSEAYTAQALEVDKEVDSAEEKSLDI